VLIGDLLKGFVPAALGTWVDGRPLGVACGVAAMLGHIFPPTRRFKGGGKGVAALGGACCFLYPLVALACVALWAVLMRFVRMASVASLAMAVLLPVGVAIGGRPAWEVGVMAAASAVVIIRHRSNIGRIARGEERIVEPR
jgi:glycerol-3-phosphate acyltransferase PlsY